MSDLKSIDTIEYLRSKHIQYYTDGVNTREGWVQVKCPFCDDHSSHLGINLESNGISCYKCKCSGTIIKLAMKLEKKGFEPTLKILENYTRNYVHPLYTAPASRGDCIFPKGINNWSKIPNSLSEFIRSRQLSLGNLMRHSNGWTGPYSEKPCRIVFPITYNGELASYVMRDYSGIAEKKYINAEDSVSRIPAKKMLYGFDTAPKNSTIIVVEGILDKLKLGKHAVATLGISYTKEQVLNLQYLNTKKIIFCFDSEVQAQKTAKNMASQIWWCPSEVIELVGKKDPGELTELEGAKLMQQLL
jgi:DNA primase